MLGPWRHCLLLSRSRLSFSMSALVVKESAVSQSCITRSCAGKLRHEIEVGPKWIGRKTQRESARITFTCYCDLCVKPTTNPSSHFLLLKNLPVRAENSGRKFIKFLRPEWIWECSQSKKRMPTEWYEVESSRWKWADWTRQPLDTCLLLNATPLMKWNNNEPRLINRRLKTNSKSYDVLDSTDSTLDTNYRVEVETLMTRPGFQRLFSIWRVEDWHKETEKNPLLYFILFFPNDRHCRSVDLQSRCVVKSRDPGCCFTYVYVGSEYTCQCELLVRPLDDSMWPPGWLHLFKAVLVQLVRPCM